MATNTKQPQTRGPRKVAEIRTVTTDCLWSIDTLAAYLDVSKDTIYEWRKKGGGPPARKVGKVLRWKPSDVDAWLDSAADAA